MRTDGSGQSRSRRHQERVVEQPGIYRRRRRPVHHDRGERLLPPAHGETDHAGPANSATAAATAISRLSNSHTGSWVGHSRQPTVGEVAVTTTGNNTNAGPPDR